MKKFVLRSLVRAILDQPRGSPKRYQRAINAEVLAGLTGGLPHKKNKTRSPEERFWRRVVQEDSCWLWRGRSMTLRREEDVINPRRFAIEQFAGGTLPPGKTPSPTCGHDRCVNPEHQTLRRKGESRLSQEQVEGIKNDPRPHPQIAKAYGVCRSYVSQIRSGKRRIAESEPDIGFKLSKTQIGPPSAGKTPEPES